MKKSLDENIREDVLGRIIEVEKEIQTSLDKERMKSQEWIEKVRADASEEILREEEMLKEAFQRAIMESKLEGERKAHEIVIKASQMAERLKGISDDDLSRILMKHMVRILPGGQS